MSYSPALSPPSPSLSSSSSSDAAGSYSGSSARSTGAPVVDVLERWLASPKRRHFAAHARFPARAAKSRPFPDWLDPQLVASLARQGIRSLYRHQLSAIESARRGESAVIATPTASGKSLCYNLSVFHELLADPTARALYLFPTKALARDQVAAARELAALLGGEIGIAVYDGDTPPDERRAAPRARILATNPDMLHNGILPNHPRWSAFWAGLKVVVVDELHVYRGVFGSHVANVLQRMRRVAEFHGAAPRFVGTSATIANASELACQLWGAPVREIVRDGAPAGDRHFLIYNPPEIDPALGLRANYLKATCELTRQLVMAGVGTLVFCRSRRAVEVLVRYLRDALAQDYERKLRILDAPASPRPDGETRGSGEAPLSGAALASERVRGYRGGYLPDRRRGVEHAMRHGNTDVVIATSALELGIDIGALDAVVMAGWPGSRAATWQRAGRAGRRLAPSLALLVASSDPLDQFVAANPEYLFDQSPEHARIDPTNVSILAPHIKCAAFELPFVRGEAFAPLDSTETQEALSVLAEAKQLHRSSDRFFYIGAQFPANDVPLRGPLDANFVVVDRKGGHVIAEVDYRDAPQVLHQHAIYQLEGRQYHVDHLDHERHQAEVSSVDVDYYTDAMTQLRLRILESAEELSPFAHGEVHVVERVVGFKKIKLRSHENVGYGDVNQPDREMHTSAFWITLGEPLVRSLDRTAAEVAAAALGLAHMLHWAAALILMSDVRDLGRAVGASRGTWFTGVEAGGRRRSEYAASDDPLLACQTPRLFLYDRYPGGTGLSDRLFQLRRTLLERASAASSRCACADGCPACIGPGAGAAAKSLATRIARLLLEHVGEGIVEPIESNEGGDAAAGAMVD